MVLQVEPLSGPEFGNTLVSLRSAGLPRPDWSRLAQASSGQQETCQTPLSGCPNLELTEHQVLVREYPSAALHGHSKRGAQVALPVSVKGQMVNFSLSGHEFSFTWTRLEIALSRYNRPLAPLPPLISLAWWSTAVLLFHMMEN